VPEPPLAHHAVQSRQLRLWPDPDSAAEFLPATVLGGFPASCVYVYLGTLVGSLAALGAMGTEAHQHHWMIWLLQAIA